MGIRQPTCRRCGFTLVEVLIVVVIMAILAATIIPEFGASARDAKASSAAFNLHTLRSVILIYESQHDGRLPGATLVELTSRTDLQGTVGTGATHIYGPYMIAIPENPFTGKNTVRTAAANPPAAASGATDAAWLYHPASGNLWIDDAALLTK